MKNKKHSNIKNEYGKIVKCPICGKFEAPNNSYRVCKFCCFEFDTLQIEEPDYAGGANTMSVNQMRKWWKYKTSFDKNFVFTDENPSASYKAHLFWDTCPICGEKIVLIRDKTNPEYREDKDGAKCTKCGWIRDLVQAVEPDMKNGLNKLSVNEYKKEYLFKKGGKD